MSEARRNHLGQPIGPDIPHWSPRPALPETPMDGVHCRLERLDPTRHSGELQANNALDTEGRNWTYLPYGPFATVEEHRAWAESVAAGQDPQFWAIVAAGPGRAVGVASLLRTDRANGVTEVGHINYSPALQRTPAATEAMYLLMRRLFDELGYRRYEWKCDALNAPSRAAAARLGFTYEGTFRQAVVNRGRNRDTAWFSIIDTEWPRVSAALAAWLDPGNFDAAGRQRSSLADLRA
jgi:RimJ/RimL family protein N-acetyltransferase